MVGTTEISEPSSEKINTDSPVPSFAPVISIVSPTFSSTLSAVFPVVTTPETLTNVPSSSAPANVTLIGTNPSAVGLDFAAALESGPRPT